MIISHKHEFIFVKTRKTAGTSIEYYLAPYCGPDDVLTMIDQGTVEGHEAQNHFGFFNPLKELLEFGPSADSLETTLDDLLDLDRFYNHLPASRIKARVPKKIWDDYFVFCFERNPWGKNLSRYYMWRERTDSRDTSFDAFMTRGTYCLNYPLYMDQSSDDIIVDYVGKYEHLEDELDWIFSGLGIPFDGSLDVSLKSHYSKPDASYSEVMRQQYPDYIDRVARIYRKEIELHGYTFEDCR